MKHCGKLDIATGASAGSKSWKNKSITWSWLVEKLAKPVVTEETYKTYMASSKDDQSHIKDVGGFVGGYLHGGRRKPNSVIHRQLLTLDIDFAHAGLWDDLRLQFVNAAVLHGTHKHSAATPRFRLIMPLSREATAEEYEAIARKVAGELGIELFDSTTFQPSRLMFWPSVSCDASYYYEAQDGPWLDTDAMLATYQDWKDTSLWPNSKKDAIRLVGDVKKQEDPRSKKGLVGAFCRTYSISEAIDVFLPKAYIDCGAGRYTFTGGSTAAGVVVYEDLFAYSHHSTDPICSKLVNAFDLVRLHLFGDQDTDASSKASFTKMQELCANDERVKGTLALETLNSSKYDFQDEPEAEPQSRQEDLEWMAELELDAKGKYISSAFNISHILTHDRYLSKCLRINTFDRKKYVWHDLPWRKVPSPEPIKNVDYAGVRNYMETVYGVTSVCKVEDAMALEFQKNQYNPVLDYLGALEWDGIKRIDTLLIDLFGAPDNVYVREAIRKMLVGAVARVLNPGVKFDLVLTLVSVIQGTGKSSFFAALGGAWFSDSFFGVNGKEALEQLQGVWILEMAELKGLRKTDVEAVKQFISKQEDMYRPAYDRVPETYKRQCVFVATTNEIEFLRDPSGNRRFMPIVAAPVKLAENAKLTEFIYGSRHTIDMIWAEAKALYKAGEKLYLSKAAEAIAGMEQQKHSESDERTGMIEEYLDMLLPEAWDKMDLAERRTFLNDPLSAKGTVQRKHVCIAEIWCECLLKDKTEISRYKTRDINDILRALPGWEAKSSTKNFKIYGTQKYYERI